MATERKNGAGHRLAGVLERTTAAPPEPPMDREPERDAIDSDEPTRAVESAEPVAMSEPASKGRGGASGGGSSSSGSSSSGSSASARKSRSLATRTAMRVKGRTIYMGDDLFERLLVQSHRRQMTISDYVCSILDQRVPDHLQAARADAG